MMKMIAKNKSELLCFHAKLRILVEILKSSYQININYIVSSNAAVAAPMATQNQLKTLLSFEALWI
jgi:hypothetical protein